MSGLWVFLHFLRRGNTFFLSPLRFYDLPFSFIGKGLKSPLRRGREEKKFETCLFEYIYIYITNPLLFNPHQFSQLEEIKPQLFISFKTLTERDNKNLILARGMTWLPRAFFFLQIPRDGILSSTPFSGYQFESSCLSCPTYPASSQLSIFPRFSLQRERREREKRKVSPFFGSLAGSFKRRTLFVLDDI